MAPPMKPSREEMLAVTMNQKLAKQGAKTRKLAEARDVNTMPDPKTYAAVMGMLGTRPDEMGFSVAHPQYKEIMAVAEPAFVAGTAAQLTPFAKPAAAGVKATGRAVGQALNDRLLSGQSLTPGLNTPAPISFVVKPKGGNWLTGSVESSVKPLKITGPTHRDEALILGGRWAQDADTPRGIRTMAESAAINNWIDRNLTNYIKKEMATPEDPVRKLADQNISHLPKDALERGEWLSEQMEEIRRMEGFPGGGFYNTNAGRGWENLADEAISITSPSGVGKKGLEENPWLSKLDPQQSVYRARSIDMRELGFDHIIDVLREDLAAGRIRPEQLSKVSMEQAVRRTHEYDQEMAKKMREAAIKQTEGMPVHKEYPEGYRWVELAPPKELPAGYSVVKDDMTGSFKVVDASGKDAVKRPENQMGHINVPFHKTEESAIAEAMKYDKRLEDALKYEGETMGHCVGGYCPDVLEGRSRIYSLRDAKGEPHVTVEVQPSATLTPEKRAAQIESLMHRMRGEGMSEEAAMRQVEKLYPESETFSRIVQIKGKQNRAPNEQYLPYVQDFVKGGQWSDVGDLRNTGLVEASSKLNHLAIQRMKERGMQVPKYATEDELNRLFDDYLNTKPPEEGMKDGGEVKATPVKNKQALGMSKALQAVHGFASKPFGYNNPPGEMISEFLGIPATARTLERMGYGEPLTTGKGMTTKPREDTMEALMSVAPLAPATKNLPVGAVIKNERGNWLAGNPEKAVAVLKSGTIAGETPAQRIPRHEELLKDPLLSAESRASVERHLAQERRRDALDKWVDSNLLNYVKKDMGSPSDTIRLTLDKRRDEIEAKFAKEQQRAQKIVDKANAEVDPRKKANLMRQSQQMLAEASFEKDLATSNMFPIRPELQDYAADVGTVNQRVLYGFPEQGMARNPEASAWENFADESIFPTKVKDYLETKEGYGKYVEAKDSFEKALHDARERMTQKWIDAGLSQKQAAAATSKMDIFDLDSSLGDTNLVRLTNEMNKYASTTNLIRAEQLKNNPWIEKLNPEEPIYKTSAGSVLNMNLDHVIDVLREDLTVGRISPEQLNKVSIDQAIRRTQEYDIENARKMIQAKNAAREGMPVYKEYPEGFKWYELNRPGDFAAESQSMGHSVRGYEPPYGHEDWVEGSGEMGSLGYGHGGWEGIKSGRAKVYSLVDPKGQSHVTVEVGKPYLNRGFRGEANVPTGDEHTRLLEEYVQGQREGTIPSNITAAEYWRQKQGIAEPELPFEITQIKGKQNAAPNEEYLPFVQDFVTSSGMSVTRDLQNTGLRDISKMPQIQEYLKKKGIDTPRYIPEKQYLEYEDDFLMDQLYPPNQGMKRGGEVKMGVGGLLGKAAKAAKTAKGAENVVVPAAPTIVIPSKISNVKEAIRESKGDFGARRVERAADEIPNLEKLYKEEALRQAFGGDNARAVMTMNPADFEKYAKGLSKRTKADIGPKMAELAKKGEIDKHTLTTDEYIQYLRGLTHGFDDVPFLSIDKEEFGLPLKPFISGHEGRHRSRALAESGQPTSLVRLFPSAELREPLPRRSQEEYIQALRDELELTGNLVLPEGRTGPAVVLPDIYAKGGEVKMGKGGNPSKKKAIDDFWAGMKEAVPPANDLGPLDTLKQNLSAAYEGAKKIPGNLYNLATDPAGYVKNLPAPTGQQIMDAFGPGNVGAGFMGSYRPHTPLKPDPEVGTRYKVQDMGGLAPRKELDIEKIQGSQAKIFPWDATHRNKLVTEVSEVPLTKPVLTEGGDEYMLDVNHIKNRIAGASNEGIANRIQDRINQASWENLNLGGTGKVYGFPSRMGEGAEFFSTFPADIAMDLLKQGALNKKELAALTKDIRTMKFEGKDAPFAGAAPVGTPEFEAQLRTGIPKSQGKKGQEIPGATAGNLRKGLMDRLGMVGYQKRLGYNLPDLQGAVLAENLKGVPKGYVGNVAAELDPGAALRPSKSSSYSTDFSGQYAGSMANMPVEFLMPNTYELIYRQMREKYPKDKYPKLTPESFRNMTIGAMEKRKENISEMIGQRSIDAVKTYQEGLKKGEFNPNNIQEVYDYMRRKKLELKLKSGGAVQTKSGLLKVKRKK